MKALLINPPTPPSFWTLKEDCWLSGTRTLAPPLGLITMAALLPPDWELKLADLDARPMPTGAWEWADMIMITGMVVHKDAIIALIREGRTRGKTVVVGGPYVTSRSQEVLDAGADFLFQGEVEDIMPLFLTALEAGKTKGVFQGERRPKMTDSPIPRFDLLPLEDYTVMCVQTSRGCPYDCEFCDVVNLYGRKPRYKKPGQVLAELEALFRLGWRGNIFISDDNFIGNRRQAQALLAQLIPWMKSHGEPFGFWTQASVNLGQDQEMMDLMTAANFSNIFVGVESTDAEVLDLHRKYQNIHNPLAESLGNMNRSGLSVVASFVLGFDGEKKGAGERICEFVEKLHIPAVMLNLLQILPNTSLWQRLQAEGRLREAKTTGNTLNLQLNYIPTRPEAEIIEEYLQAAQCLYEPSAYLQRAFQAILNMRPTRRALSSKVAEEQAAPRQNDPGQPKRRIREILSLLKLVWRQGIRPPYRWQFWKQLVAIIYRNPSRKVRYLVSCGLGESMFTFRRLVTDRLKGPAAKISP